MKIWVDADACPVAIKEILFRAAVRTQTTVMLVANQSLKVPPSPYIKSIQVLKGFDVADNEIIRQSQNGDLVITSDIPLADDVIKKGALALSPRGDLFSKDNIKAWLNMRDFLDTMRASGVDTGGPSPLTDKDNKKFADSLDRILTQNKKLVDY
ncbi:MAG: YaiI/YqxD family protein [Gammaproteobacteria bacterium]|nr:YaiI/YqxD family protein [Gammaproteobacteria bacterium]